MVAEHRFLVGEVQAVKWQMVQLASWGVWSRLSNAAHLSNLKLVLLCKGEEWVYTKKKKKKRKRRSALMKKLTSSNPSVLAALWHVCGQH